jgi:outer membrane protein TolC
MYARLIIGLAITVISLVYLVTVAIPHLIQANEDVKEAQKAVDEANAELDAAMAELNTTIDEIEAEG